MEGLKNDKLGITEVDEAIKAVDDAIAAAADNDDVSNKLPAHCSMIRVLQTVSVSPPSRLLSLLLLLLLALSSELSR